VAPADLAAFSIFFLHMPHSPATLKDSDLVCANTMVEREMNKKERRDVLSVFMLNNF
jgi:hypothetical protein